MTIKGLFAEDYVAQTNEGQLLHGWGREGFEMLDETQQAHTVANTKANFAKPFIEQDPFFVVSNVLKRLLQSDRGASQLGENGLDAHGFNTERATLGGGPSLLTA